MYKYRQCSLFLIFVILVLSLTACKKAEEDFVFVDNENRITYGANYGKASTFGVSSMGELPVYQN